MTDTPTAREAAHWPRCIRRIDDQNCRGVRVPGYGVCAGCLTDDQFNEFVDAIALESRLDLRGTRIGVQRLQRIINAREGRFEEVLFGQAHFEPSVSFDGCIFSTSVSFERATFDGEVAFRGATFGGRTSFAHVIWNGSADFTEVTFAAGTGFTDGRFEGGARFERATIREATLARARFRAGVRFTGATFAGPIDLAGLVIKGDADFDDCNLDCTGTLGPIVVEGTISFRAAEFARPARVLAAASAVSLDDATLKHGGVLFLRHANVRMDRMTTEERLTVVGHGGPVGPDEAIIPASRRRDGRPRPVSLQQVDCANLGFEDVDLAICQFVGAFHLDKLGLEGRCTFASRGPRTGRHVAAEEVLLRARSSRSWQRRAERLELTGDTALTPQRLASIYRQLRKALEDAKDEPGAGDFYYAEMDMRRRSTGRSWAERAILWLYWLLGGYGLRAWRPLVALAVLILAASFAFVTWPAPGTPAPPQRIVIATTSTPSTSALTTAATPGTVPPVRATAVPSSAAVTVTVSSAPVGKPRPTNWLGGVQLALESSLSLLRTPATPVSDRGAWVQLGLRLIGPVLLAMAILGIRSRVKR
jgi:uncharacterized protein YjbI with pentapeptide repeats